MYYIPNIIIANNIIYEIKFGWEIKLISILKTNELVKSLKPTKEDGHPHYDRFADAFTEEMDRRLEVTS